jgi:sec-independent protein translocase protein TatA
MITAAIFAFLPGNVGGGEILAILIVLGLVFGANRLPEIGANLGKGIKNFRKSFSEPDGDEKKKLEENDKQKPVNP